MALIHYDLTVGTAAVALTSVNGNKGILEMHIGSPVSTNAYVGKSGTSATSYGYVISAGSSGIPLKVGPFSGHAPLNTKEVYVAADGADVVHVLVVTH